MPISIRLAVCSIYVRGCVDSVESADNKSYCGLMIVYHAEVECFSVHCHVFAIIKEMRFGRSATVCGGVGDAREKHAYTSEGNSVEIRFMTGGKAGQYLLKYEGWCMLYAS